MSLDVHEIQEGEYFGRTADQLDPTQTRIDHLHIQTSVEIVEALAFCGSLKEDETLAPGTRLLLQAHGVLARLESIRCMTDALMRREPNTEHSDAAVILRAAERALKELKPKSKIPPLKA